MLTKKIENLANDLHSTNNIIADVMAKQDNKGFNSNLKSASKDQFFESKISAVVEYQELISVKKMCDTHDKSIKRLKQEFDSYKQFNSQYEKFFNIISTKIDISDQERLKSNLIR